MSEWRGLHNPDWHDSVGVRAWCRCGTWCSEGAECDCCELVELRAEVERLRVTVERVREVCGVELDEGGFGYGRDERRVGWNNLRADILDVLDGDR